MLGSNAYEINIKNILYLSEEILNRIEGIKLKILGISYVMMHHHFITGNIGVEELATYMLKDALEKYDILVGKVLFRMKGTIESLVNLLNNLIRFITANASEVKLLISIS